MNPRPLLFLFVATALLLPCSRATARIGETLEQCIARYGEPVKAPSPDSRIFQKGGFFIVVTFFDETADSLVFRKVHEDILKQPDEISDNEIALLMRGSGEGKTWTQVTASPFERTWITDDGQLRVDYSKMDRLLYIITKGAADRATAAKKQDEQKKLDGF